MIFITGPKDYECRDFARANNIKKYIYTHDKHQMQGYTFNSLLIVLGEGQQEIIEFAIYRGFDIHKIKDWRNQDGKRNEKQTEA